MSLNTKTMLLNKCEKAHNKRQQSDLGKLSSFLQKAAKMPPSRPNRCGGRYVGYKMLLTGLVVSKSSVFKLVSLE